MNLIAVRLNSAQLSLPWGLSADYPAKSLLEYDLLYRGIIHGLSRESATSASIHLGLAEKAAGKPKSANIES